MSAQIEAAAAEKARLEGRVLQSEARVVALEVQCHRHAARDRVPGPEVCTPTQSVQARSALDDLGTEL